MQNYTDLFIQLGLAKNEARIYETLLSEGQSSVGEIAKKSQVHRRNVYDSLNRLVEKGLVFEIIQSKENRYEAVDPKKLSEVLEEKQSALTKAMPDLESLYANTPHRQDVFIYKGFEGLKNYMRDIIRVGQDVYFIGGKGLWAHKQLSPFFEQFKKETTRKSIKFHMLFDWEMKEQDHQILKELGDDQRILPKEFSTHSAIAIFGDYVVIYNYASADTFSDDTIEAVIINPEIADSFRIWFKLMWSASLDLKSTKI